ncbi:MAG: GNAT family N-acetyltransferase [Deltaproteobacteria bacterium]|nr:GNAT family N-acetyltransferase [Deltaproteobacteria bacterium]
MSVVRDEKQLSRAWKEGVQVEITRDGNAIDEFHRLDVMTRRRQGVPPHPRRFLHNLHRYIIEKNKGFCMVASVARKIIADYIYLLHGKTVLFKFGASDDGYFELRPNHFLIWEAMKWGIENGYTKFHFGRTDISHDTLRQFKLKAWRSGMGSQSDLPWAWFQLPLIKPYIQFSRIRLSNHLLPKAFTA